MKKTISEIRKCVLTNGVQYIEGYIPNFRYRLIALNAIPDEKILKIKDEISAILYIDKPNRRLKLIDALKEIEKKMKETKDRSGITDVLRYIAWYLRKKLEKVVDEDRLEELEGYAREGEVNEMFKTVDRELKEMIDEGRLENAQESVIDAIEAKFDVVPEDIANTIKGIEDMDVLKGLLKRAIKSETLDEFRKVLETIKEK